MNVKECYNKQKKEFKRYRGKYQYNNLYIRLRDLLIYLYNYYELNVYKDRKLDVTLMNCIGEFAKEERIYKTTPLRVDDYYEKLYKIDGKKVSLREYDENVVMRGKELKIDKKGKVFKKKRSCSSYDVVEGCPSHCDIPKDVNRKTCVVKGRKREYIRKIRNRFGSL